MLRRKSFLIGASLAIVIVLAGAGFVFFQNTKESTDSPLSSEQNIDLINNAKENMDISICDKIRGGIIGPPEKPKDAIGDAFGYPTMTESEAKKLCKESVQWRIDHQVELKK